MVDLESAFLAPWVYIERNYIFVCRQVNEDKPLLCNMNMHGEETVRFLFKFGNLVE